MERQTRRQFLDRAALGAAGVVCGSLASLDRQAAANQPDPKSIIDTHTHFYDPQRPEGVPWPDKEDKFLYRRVLPQDFEAIARPLGVTGTVVVEASPRLEDNQWLLDLAAKDKFIVGVVGHLTPDTESFRKEVDRFAKNRLYRGIRIGSGELKQKASREPFMLDLRYLAEMDLSLDILGEPDMLGDVAHLAKEIPELRIVIDHCALKHFDGKELDSDWSKGIHEMGDYENIFCKVSGLVDSAASSGERAPADPKFYEPVLDALWKSFGDNRLLYGSNWPVSERFASYKTVLEIIQHYVKAKSEKATEKFFWRNAQFAYKWATR